MERLGVGIIGCGRIFDLHMLGYRERAEKVLAIADINQAALESRANTYGIEKKYTDYRQLLEDEEIHLVEILTPHHLHFQMCLDAIQAGKHVSLQKPPTLNIAELDQLIAAAKARGTVLRIYENFIFYPPIIKAKELVEEGAIGTPINIRMRSLAGSAQSGWEVPLESWAWRVREETCGGGPFVFDDGYHKFSIAIYLMGDVEKVHAWMDRTKVIEDVYVDAPSICTWKHVEEKRYGSLDFTWSYDMYIKSNYYAQDDRVEITGTEGVVWVTRGHGNMLDIPPVLLYRDGKLTAFTDIQTDWGVSFQDATRHLLDVLREGSPPRLSGQEARRILQFSLAVIRSAREGREVRLDEIT